MKKLYLSFLILGAFAALSSTLCATDLATLQRNYVDQGYGMFLHYNMGTYYNSTQTDPTQAFIREEWAPAKLPVNTFNPGASITAGTDQWASVAKAAGMSYGVLTVKHHDGFALWNSSQSSYDIASTSWYSNPSSVNYQTDIVQSFANSFRNQGLGVGLYYSIWDKTNGIGPTHIWSPEDPTNTKQLSWSAATTYEENELHQLLTNYGHIDTLWLDGWGWTEGPPVSFSQINFTTIYNYVKSISPDTLIVVNSHEGNLDHSDIAEYEKTQPAAGNSVPSEVCNAIRADGAWFYHPTGTDSMNDPSYLADQILTANSRDATYLLDVPPDRNGLIPQSEIDCLTEIKSYLVPEPGTWILLGGGSLGLAFFVLLRKK